MSELVGEIMDYVKLKDRPSAFVLDVASVHGNHPRLHFRITAPIESGKLAW